MMDKFRPWTAMLDTWTKLLGELAGLVRPDDPIAVEIWGSAGQFPPRDLHLLTWRWMWSLPPCSEARKAAFSLGHAALLIERWRTCITTVQFCPDDGFPLCDGYMVGPDDGKTPLQTSAEKARALPEALAIGQIAEEKMRIAAWHIEDAHVEQDQGRYHDAPAPPIPPHERVYERHVPACGDPTCPRSISIAGKHFSVIPADLARTILADHFSVPRPKVSGSAWLLGNAFEKTAIASLPNCPWTMTSQDVSRFLDMLTEDVKSKQRSR